MARCRKFIRDARGGATVEFVAIVPVFMLIAFFTMEVAIAVLWIGTAEKAAQLGARLAVVSNLAVTGLPSSNGLTNSTYTYGQPCSAGACTSFATKTCTGGSGGVCSSANFTTIVNRMSGIFSLIQSQYVTISYTYIGLGFAGGPIVPNVTVTVSGVPMGGVMTSIFGRFFSLNTLPTISATFTGEDLNSAGAP
jgi:Flp pilus assembly protein TadG